MSIRKGSRTIASSVPVTEWGSVDGTLADQVDLKSALDSKAPSYSPTFTGTPIAPTAPIDTSNNQIATTKYVQDALLNAEANLPEQSGNAGKFLTTNGQLPSWESITGLPSQASQSGKFLTTDGTSASWGTIDLSGKVDKVTTSSSKNRFYIITPAGVQSVLDGEQSGQTAATVAIRTTSGTIRTNTPTDNNDAATKKYVDDNTVSITTDETITGQKTFHVTNSDTTFIIKSKSLDLTSAPAADGDVEINWKDKNGNTYGVDYLRSNTSGNIFRGISCKAHNSDTWSSLIVGYDSSDNVYTSAPTPSSVTDNTTKIATTAWVINVLQALYPVGSLYMGTQNSCPLSAFFGTWTLVSAGNALWTGNGTSGSGTTANANYANAAANTTIAAGLPNHSHTVGDIPKGQNDGNKDIFAGGNNDVVWKSVTSSLASASNQIYGNSTTVQPPAYVVNVWRRTA